MNFGQYQVRTKQQDKLWSIFDVDIISFRWVEGKRERERERERELENKKAGFGSCEMVSRFRQEDDGGGEFIGRADSRKIHSHKKLLFRYFDARDWSGVNFSCQIEIAFLRSKFKHIFTDLHFVTTSKELTEDDKDILFDRQEWCL